MATSDSMGGPAPAPRDGRQGGAGLDVTTYARLFQVCDSTFPIGSFNHSFGMENYLSDRRIRKAPQFEEWFEAYFRSQYAYGEGLLVRLAFEALDAGDTQRVWDLDRIIYCSTPARETREVTRRIARQMVSLIGLLHSQVPLLDEYAGRMAAGESFGNPALAFSLLAHECGADARQAFVMYGYSVASTLAQNAVRAVPLGQRQGQVALDRVVSMLGPLWDLVEGLDESYLGACVPGLELAQMRHEIQVARLFMS